MLVGRTSSSGTAEGIRLLNDGFGGFHRDNAEVIQVDRKTSDGTLISLRKNGSTVGTIGVSSDGASFGNATQHVAMHSGKLFPASPTHSALDNTIDLGYSGGRFKNLYLTGGIYLGGTGSANKLDDVETGSFTPSVSGLTFTTAVGTYVKIGRVCHISINLSGSNNSTSADIYVSGLPFTAPSGNYGAQSVPLMEVSNISLASGYTNMYGRINASDTRLQLLQSAGTAHANMNAGGGLNTGATLRASFTYQTNA